MKRIIYSAAMLFALLTTACGGGNKEASELPQIDVNTNYPEKEICLQDVAEVSINSTNKCNTYTQEESRPSGSLLLSPCTYKKPPENQT